MQIKTLLILDALILIDYLRKNIFHNFWYNQDSCCFYSMRYSKKKACIWDLYIIPHTLFSNKGMVVTILKNCDTIPSKRMFFLQLIFSCIYSIYSVDYTLLSWSYLVFMLALKCFSCLALKRKTYIWIKYINLWIQRFSCFCARNYFLKKDVNCLRSLCKKSIF